MISPNSAASYVTFLWVFCIVASKVFSAVLFARNASPSFDQFISVHSLVFAEVYSYLSGKVRQLAKCSLSIITHIFFSVFIQIKCANICIIY